MSNSPTRPNLASAVREAVAFVSQTRPVDLASLINDAPAGDGHSVLVLPATLRGDGYTEQTRTFLTRVGYRAEGWSNGVNLGPTRRLLAGTEARLNTLADERGPVSVIGFSMGGLFARWLAQQSPARVRQVITVCSPFRAPAESLAVSLEPFLGLWPGVDLRALAREVGRPVGVPATCPWSLVDGVVDPAMCREDESGPHDNVAIDCSHVLIAQDPLVMRILARRLADRCVDLPRDTALGVA